MPPGKDCVSVYDISTQMGQLLIIIVLHLIGMDSSNYTLYYRAAQTK